MSADSIPSQCIYCQLPYYRQGVVAVYAMSYFCIHCRTELSAAKWKLLGKFHSLLTDITTNQAYWDKLHKLNLPDEEFFIAKGYFLRKIFEAMATNMGREQLFAIFQDTKLYELMTDRILDLVELFEEYEKILKENQNGQKRKTTTD